MAVGPRYCVLGLLDASTSSGKGVSRMCNFCSQLALLCQGKNSQCNQLCNPSSCKGLNSSLQDRCGEWILLVHKGNGPSVDPPLPCNHAKNVNTITVSIPCLRPYFPIFALENHIAL